MSAPQDFLHRSWQAVVRKDWIIKFSTFRSNICLIFISIYTGRTIIRFFDDEDRACDFINFVLSIDGTSEDELE